MKHLILLLTLLAAAPCLRAEAVVSNVWAAQIPGTHQVRITYDLTAAAPCTVSVQVWIDGEPPLNVPATAFTGDVTQTTATTPNLVSPGTGKAITLTVARTKSDGSREVLAADLDEKFTKNLRFKVLATESTTPPAPEGFVLIPAGDFMMGNVSGDTDLWITSAAPPVNVTVSGFYMARYEVTKELWDEVRTWGAAAGRGYTDLRVGGGKAANHPVHTVSWWDVVKWCNARSEMEGLVAVYRNSNGTVFTTGTTVPTPNWSANGYRLPTEAEWEKAARGGVTGLRFPWGDTINHGNANYYANSSAFNYDTSGYTNTYHPSYTAGGTPYTAPVNSFTENGYGLYNMAGNVMEWCWDYGASTYVNGATNPHGATSGSSRVIWGGDWSYYAISCRAAGRLDFHPTNAYNRRGFRPARSSVP